MLKNIDPLLGPDLLRTLRAMGHGDEKVVGKPQQIEPVMAEFASVIARHEPQVKLAALERLAFYERVRQSFAVVATGDTRLYANLILKKGVIRPEKSR